MVIASLVFENEKPHNVSEGYIKGNIVRLSNKIRIPSLKVPDEILIKDEYIGEPLLPGVHAFKKLNLKGNEVISTTNNQDSVIIYVTEGVKITGVGELKVGDVPRSLIIFGTESLRKIDISGNRQINGIIYAPDSEIIISGNAVIYGSVVGDKVIYKK
jgi:hypothetical protein